MLGYLSGVYDVLRLRELNKIDMAIQKNLEKGNKYFALALYSDELCEELGLGTPLKNIEDRRKIASFLSGVNFTFEISNLEKESIQKSAQEALEKHLAEIEKQEKSVSKKDYNIAYAPGTYDLFHAGHLENLLQAACKSEKLIVGVKSDELVQSHKGRLPMLSAQERMEILRHFNFVDNVYQYYTRDPHSAIKWIKSKYGQDVDAMFLGSDLKKDFEDIKDINIIFTDREPSVMETRSTTAYRKKLLSISGYSTLDGRYTNTNNESENIKEDEKER